MKQISEIGVSLGKKLTALGFTFLYFSIEVWAQMPQVVIPDDAETAAPAPSVAAEDNTWWYILLVLLAVGLAGAIYWMKVSKNQQKEQAKKSDEKPTDRESVDYDKELEWFRKNRNVINKQKSPNGKLPKNFPKTSNIINSKGNGSVNKETRSNEPNQKKSEDYAPKTEQMPVFSIERLEFARPFDKLPISNDPALMSAIEQTQDEFEEDEGFRELSVKVLAAFQTCNAVESLSQVALYDLSSFLRSKAVAVLADFDHESVFETILLACADPTREVRAAAARGLFQVTFDRADAWTRIGETNDEFRIRQAARAATEADLGERYFERLIHKDVKSAYEAFAFVALLLKSDETENVFEAMQSHRDINVRKAILHVIKVTKEPNALEGLYSILENDTLPPEMREEADRLVEEIGLAVI